MGESVSPPGRIQAAGAGTRFANRSRRRPTMKSSSQKKRARSKSPSRAKATKAGDDAIEVLKRQHREVEALLARFDKARTNEDARALAADICDKLKVHS